MDRGCVAQGKANAKVSLSLPSPIRKVMCCQDNRIIPRRVRKWEAWADCYHGAHSQLQPVAEWKTGSISSCDTLRGQGCVNSAQLGFQGVLFVLENLKKLTDKGMNRGTMVDRLKPERNEVRATAPSFVRIMRLSALIKNATAETLPPLLARDSPKRGVCTGRWLLGFSQDPTFSRARVICLYSPTSLGAQWILGL